MDQAGQRLEDIQETVDANAELLASKFHQWDVESSSLARSPQGKYQLSIYILSFV
jgi:hypothetical protein